MYAQITVLRAPMGKMGELRTLIEGQYLTSVQKREGFVSAYLLEQVDDRDSAQLITVWDNHAALENARRTGLLQETIEGLAVQIPHVKIQRQGYVVSTSVIKAFSEAVV